ncbi:hypothetical protein [Cochleicola gelatinilyticus]|nr:hypothetical protein [Cochleicola gelatinilyticus]
MKQFLALISIVVFFASCSFTETMTLQEDGSGRMAIEMDLSEMMAFGGDLMKDSIPKRIDSIISFKQFLEEKKDSIATLPEAEQRKLKKLENYKLHMVIDTDEGTMVFDMFTDFSNVAEANELMNGMQNSSRLMPSMGDTNVSKTEDASGEVFGTSFSFTNDVFKRDAYIIDEAAHKKQLDSMQGMEAFMGSSTYKLKYTFPKKIKEASVEDATFSLDGKTIVIERSFTAYIRNPDVLDLEVILENE